MIASKMTVLVLSLYTLFLRREAYVVSDWYMQTGHMEAGNGNETETGNGNWKQLK